VPDLDEPSWRLLAHSVAFLLAIASLIATLLPLLRETAWWIRVFDFPRLQIVGVALLCIVAGALLRWHEISNYWGLTLLGSLAVAVVYQGFRILPYTRQYPH
jgi:endonuclease/exonuclease/phosphatase (EEP) superfamily protein YafD